MGSDLVVAETTWADASVRTERTCCRAAVLDAGAVRVSTVLTETLVRQAADGLQPARAAR